MSAAPRGGCGEDDCRACAEGRGRPHRVDHNRKSGGPGDPAGSDRRHVDAHGDAGPDRPVDARRRHGDEVEDAGGETVEDAVADIERRHRMTVACERETARRHRTHDEGELREREPVQQPVHHEGAAGRGQQAERLRAAHRRAAGVERAFERLHEDAPRVEDPDREIDQHPRGEREVRAQGRHGGLHRRSMTGRATTTRSGGARSAYGRRSGPSRGAFPARAPGRAVEEDARTQAGATIRHGGAAPLRRARP